MNYQVAVNRRTIQQPIPASDDVVENYEDAPSNNRARSCVWPALINILFIDESMALHIYFYEISHGFDISHDLLVIARHFKDILRYYF